MAYVIVENRGNLFFNEVKTHENGADFSGTVNVGGLLHFCDIWENQGSKGKYLSIRFKLMDKQPTGTSTPEFNPNDDVPG